MSRNKEKNQLTLHRYYAEKEKEAGVLDLNPSERPKKVQSVKSLPQAERWRQTILAEISVKLTQINDPAEPESNIRLLNDEINKLHRQQRAWEHHILSLGGNDHIRYGKKTNSLYVNGVHFYGRAKDLPEAKVKTSEKKQDSVSPDYWNFKLPTTIDASKETIMAEINGALGEPLLGEKIIPLDREVATNDDVRRELLELKKEELRRQLSAN